MAYADQLSQIAHASGFIAALDQSGGSTPKALAAYGITDADYTTEADMYHQMHVMRTRIMKAHCFDRDKVIGAILFERTMDAQVDGINVAQYLWDRKGVVPFLKVDHGLAEPRMDVQLMKDIHGLSDTLIRAKLCGIFGTKMRSVIHGANPIGIAQVVAQQFQLAQYIDQHGLCPIIEPEVSINIADKALAEDLLHKELQSALDDLSPKHNVMLKLTLPTRANLYRDLMDHPRVIRVVALSGGYGAQQAAELLTQNDRMIASFSRALTQDLHAQTTDAEFEAQLCANVMTAYHASL